MDDKSKALVEVLLVFIAMMAVVRLFEALPWGNLIGYLCILSLFVALSYTAVRKNDLSTYSISPINNDSKVKAIVVFVSSAFFLVLGGIWSAFVLLLLALTGRDFSKYGLTLRTLGSDLRIVAICILPVLAADYLPWLAFIIYGIGEMEYFLIFITLTFVLLFVVLLLMTKVNVKENSLLINARYIVPAVAVGSAISIAAIVWPYQAESNGGLALKIIDAMVFGFVLQAIPQEVLFRGYAQSRLNEAFGRPYVHFGIAWGAGLIITSLLFGLMHVINPFNPFNGHYDFNILMGTWTFLFGLIYGAMREKTGNIVAPTIVHGIEDTISKFLW